MVPCFVIIYLGLFSIEISQGTSIGRFPSRSSFLTDWDREKCGVGNLWSRKRALDPQNLMVQAQKIQLVQE